MTDSTEPASHPGSEDEGAEHEGAEDEGAEDEGADDEPVPDTEEDVEMKRWMMKLFGRGSSEQLDCHAVGELLQQYLDHEIDDDERALLIAAHLEDCRRCGLEAETYEQIKRTLATRRAEVPEDSVERLRDFGRGLIRGEEPSAP